jgi:MFS superfamily sulfate permease-like transporter
MTSLIAFIVGILIGVSIAILISFIIFKERQTEVGILRIDNSEPTEEPYLFLELSSDGFEKINTSHTVTLKVKKENYLSHK